MEQLISPQLFITTDSICSVHIHKLLTIYWDDTLGNLTSGTVAAACCVLSIWRQPSWRMSQKHSSRNGRQRDGHRGATGPSLRSVAPQIVLWMGWAQQTSHLPQIYLPKMHMIKFIAQVRAEINQELLNRVGLMAPGDEWLSTEGSPPWRGWWMEVATEEWWRRHWRVTEKSPEEGPSWRGRMGCRSGRRCST